MASRLIINADDFGQTPGINSAVEQLYRAGVLTSATLMASGEAFESAVAISYANPGLGVGCHIMLVDGWPVSPPDSVPSLLGRDRARFRSSIAEFAFAALSGTLRAAEVEREAEAQIQRLQRAGVHVTHFDTHKHTHLFPAVLAPLLRAAARCGVRPLRRPFEPRWSAACAGAPWKRRMQLRALRSLSAQFDRIASPIRVQGCVPDGTLGIAATGTLDGASLHKMLTALPPDGKYELCCHPGHVDAVLAAQETRLRATREVEYRALLEVIPQILRTAGAPRLIHYGDLGTTAS